MKRFETGIRNTLQSGVVLAALLLAGCSDSDSTGQAAMQCTDGGASPFNTVTLQCGAAAGVEDYFVDVELGGPSAGTTTLRGIVLDVVWSPANVQFVEEASYSSPLMPNALVAVSLFQGNQGRLVVSVVQPGTEPDVSLGPGASTVLRLRFRRTMADGFGPVALEMENAAALNANPTIQFGAGLALWNL